MFQFDHIVHFLNRDGNDIIGKFKELGLAVTAGGRHESWGTKNSLCYSENAAYIEWLSIENEEIASVCDNPLVRQQTSDLKKAEGFGQICLRTDNIEILAENLTKKGFKCQIYNGQRKRTDGIILKWKMLFLEEQFGANLPYPFFIQWEKNEKERLADLKATGVMNDFSIQSIIYLVRDAKSATRKLADILENIEFIPYRSEQPTFTGYAAKIGNVSIFFAETDDFQMAEILETRGERPAIITISGTGQNGCHHLWGGYYKFVAL